MNLSTEAWALVERLFHEVVDLSPEARASRLAASGAPAEVIATVQQLIAVEPTVVLDDGLAPEIAVLLSPAGPAELPAAGCWERAQERAAAR